METLHCVSDFADEISDFPERTKHVFTAFLTKFTCSSKTSVAVDRYLSLLQCEGHDLHHVQNSGEVGYSIVIPTKIVEIN